MPRFSLALSGNYLAIQKERNSSHFISVSWWFLESFNDQGGGTRYCWNRCLSILMVSLAVIFRPFHDVVALAISSPTFFDASMYFNYLMEASSITRSCLHSCENSLVVKTMAFPSVIRCSSSSRASISLSGRRVANYPKFQA